MVMSVLDLKLFRDLWHLRGQAMAIAVVIMGGVATLVMSLSTFNSLATTRDRFYQDYRFAQVFASLQRAPDTVAEQLAGIRGIEQLETRVVARAKLEVESFADPITGLVLSLPEAGESVLNRVHLKRGRLPEPFSNDETVLSDTFADAHQIPLGGRVHAIISGKRKALTVVGVVVSPEYVYQIAPGSMFPDFKRYGVLWMRRQALAAASDMQGAFNSVTATLRPDAQTATVLATMDDVLTRYGGRGAYERANQFSHRFLAEEMKQLNTMATVFPAIFLAVSAFLLNVVMGRLIALQREQIATLKAFGYTPWAIAWHYVKFVLLIVLLGWAAGVALGAWFGQGLARLYTETTFRFPYLDYRLNASVLVLGLWVSLVAAIGGTLLAVSRAVRLSPAEGMRQPVPVGYGISPLERWGWLRWLSTPSRMILRQVARQPVKAAFTVLGTACACGLVMVGNYQKDAIDFIVDVQFRHAAREDLAVTFTGPRSGKALHELAAIPGVVHVEGFRDVPAILKFRQHSYRSAVYGIQPQGQLHRSLDKALQPVQVPSGGVVLTDYLANNILHVQLGDTITVEVLEQERRELQLPVLGITQQYLGVSAYMRQDALNASMREGDVVSGAYLALEPGAEASVYAALEQRPQVLGMVSHATAMRSFYATLGEFVLFFNAVASLLAGSIAFGVVYNSARIALSERSRELASLRVLGFTRGEIAYILLGELALLTLAALPLGFLVGMGLIGILVLAFESELYRLPLVSTSYNYALGVAIVVASALVSAWMVWRQLGKLDLVAVLKTRE
jgi:putative ABC transport system permease protein